jgi:tRNA threonylcarbamoyladenosine biosynthesis protein TsaB
MSAGLDVRRLLALDTATENCSAALWINGEVTVLEREIGRGHAEQILPMVESLLAAAQLRLADLDALAVGRGPGGFTGVRLAISVVQGLAFGAGKPVVPVSNLRAVAQRAFDREPAASRCLVCADARMREVYCGQFLRDAAGLAVAIAAGAADGASDGANHAAEAVLPPDAVILSPAPGLVLAGRGFAASPGLRERALATGLPLLDDLLPGAAEIARLAVGDARGGAAQVAAALRPVYLRDKVAEPPAIS